MPSAVRYTELKIKHTLFKVMLSVLAILVFAGIAAAHMMDAEGHHITSMTNQVVWGLPHVFAIFLIVAASGALHIASMSSVFGKHEYQPLARLSAITSMALMIGGISILLLDLGRPDRLIIAITTFNFKSVFAWNIFLYSGFFLVVTIYLWFIMERSMQIYSRSTGLVALIWRLALTAGTGSIFGVLVTREVYDPVFFIPMFILMSFSFGIAVFIPILIAGFKFGKRSINPALLQRLGKLLGIFVITNLFFVVIFHFSKLYTNQFLDYETFILKDGGIYTVLFWLAQIGAGNLLPLLFIFHPYFSLRKLPLIAASCLVVSGAFAQLYVIIIGGQVYPLNIFPGLEVSSSFFDGVVSKYIPGIWEWLLGLAGFSISIILVFLLMRVFPVIPDSLAEIHHNDSNH